MKCLGYLCGFWRASVGMEAGYIQPMISHVHILGMLTCHVRIAQMGLLNSLLRGNGTF